MSMRMKQQGFSLVELMIGMAIGLVLVGAMVGLYVRQSQSYRQLDALARMQENARFAFEIMGRDLRMAGSWGCHIPGKPTPSNFLNGSAANWPTDTKRPLVWWMDTSRPVVGVSETADTNAVGDANFPDGSGNSAGDGGYDIQVLRGDTVWALRADIDATQGVVGAYDMGVTVVPISSLSPVKAGWTMADLASTGDLLIFSDCQTQTAVFQMTGSTGGVEHVVAATPEPGNCKADLFGGTCATPVTPTASAGARVMPLVAHAYYLRSSPRRYDNSTVNIPSLYRQILAKDGSSNIRPTAEELVEGVADMQILYGVDTDATIDHSVNSYVAASAVTDWGRVLAVRVNLVIESPDNNLHADAQTWTYFNGVTVTDRRLRRRFSATFGIRSRLN